jgi:hypothetical protein
MRCSRSLSAPVLSAAKPKRPTRSARTAVITRAARFGRSKRRNIWVRRGSARFCRVPQGSVLRVQFCRVQFCRVQFCRVPQGSVLRVPPRSSVRSSIRLVDARCAGSKARSLSMRRTLTLDGTEPAILGGAEPGAPIELNLAEPIELNLAEPIELNLAEPIELNLAEPIELNLAEPIELNLAEPIELNLAAPRRTLSNPVEP